MPAHFICQVCKRSFVSLDLLREKAVAEVGPKLHQHVMQDHPKEFQAFQANANKAMLLVSTLVAYDLLIEFPIGDEKGDQELQEATEQLMDLCGFAKDGEAEEEEDASPEVAKPPTLLVS